MQLVEESMAIVIYTKESDTPLKFEKQEVEEPKKIKKLYILI